MRNPDRTRPGICDGCCCGSTSRPALPGPTGFAQRGFTLFEVLGAVALLAIVYTMLSTAAIRGLQTEGQSRRILEASLLADLEIAKVEMEADMGAMRPLGEDEFESEDGLYLIRVDVSVFQMPEIQSVDNAAGSTALGQPGAVAPPSFGTNEQSPLREIQVEVAWGDPDDERAVYRTTYGIDPLALEELAGSAPPQNGPVR